MSLRLPGQWVWDSWFAFDGEKHHAFYLQASRALQDPDRRHRNVSVGHAVSTDLKNWTVVEDALAISDSPAFDSYTTWTGSIVRDDSGLWWMFYTGTSREDGGDIQSVGSATSKDLMTWTKRSSEALLRADEKLHAKLDKSAWHDEAFRDPFVFKFKEDDTEWQMLFTTRGREGRPKESGVMGHAVSSDLVNWQSKENLSQVNQGFGETEVFQFEIVDGVPVVLFCCSQTWISQERVDRGEIGGVYSLSTKADLSDVDFNRAVLFDSPGLYAARLIRDLDGGWNLIGFWNIVEGVFVGELSDPIAVTAKPGLGLIRR